MVKLGPAIGLLSVLAVVSASPIKRQDSSAAAPSTEASTGAETAASTATDASATSAPASSAATGSAAPETTITAFIPVSGGPPNATLYAVTAANETYLVALEPVTAVNEAGATTTVVLQDIFVVSEDELDVYVFDDQGTPLEATNCDIAEDGTTAVCNGVVVDLTAQELVAFDNLTVTGALSGVPAYLPTGTVDVSGISAATNAPALISSFEAAGGINATSLDAGSATLTDQSTTSASAIPSVSDVTVAGSDASASDTAASASTTA